MSITTRFDAVRGGYLAQQAAAAAKARDAKSSEKKETSYVKTALIGAAVLTAAAGAAFAGYGVYKFGGFKGAYEAGVKEIALKLAADADKVYAPIAQTVGSYYTGLSDRLSTAVQPVMDFAAPYVKAAKGYAGQAASAGHDVLVKLRLAKPIPAPVDTFQTLLAKGEYMAAFHAGLSTSTSFFRG